MRREARLRLPTVPLIHEWNVAPTAGDARWRRQPAAVGVGPWLQQVAVWSHVAGSPLQLVTWHGANGEPERSIVVESSLAGLGFIQPVADGGVLLVSVRRPRDAAISAQRWSSRGDLVAEADLGDAIEHVLATDSGAVWVGYFDEALTGRAPEGHGLVRFGADLQPEWLYPWNTDLPSVDDCESMNVVGETVYACPYLDHHVVRVDGGEVTDLGPAPHRGGQALLIEGDRGLLIGGYGADHDLMTPFEFTANGPMRVGSQGRVVMPDGLEARSRSWICRGGQAWTQVDNNRFRLGLSRVFDTLC